MRLAFLSSWGIAILVSACGRTGPLAGNAAASAGSAATSSGGGSQAGGRTTEGGSSGSGGNHAGGAGNHAGGAAGSGGVASAMLCTAAGWSSGSRAVAVGFSGLDVVVIDADGTRHVTATLSLASGIDESALIRGIETTADGTLVWLAWATRAPIYDQGETILLDRRGEVSWQLPGFVRSAGKAGMIATMGDEQVLVQADGTTSPLPLGSTTSFNAKRGVRSDGWVAAQWTYGRVELPESDERFGFVNLDGRPARESFAKPAGRYPSVGSHDGEAFYVANPSALALYLETPTTVRSIDLGLTTTAASSVDAQRSASRLVVSVDQRPERVVEPISGAVSVVDRDAIVGTDAFGNAWSYQLAVTPDSDFALGHDYDAPRFVLDMLSGDVEPVRLDRLAPLRPVDGFSCIDSAVLPDGRLGLALRDAALAGFYVTKPDGSGLERLGLPFRDVTTISARQVAGSWIVRGVSGANLFCSPYHPFAPAAPNEPAPLLGDSVQILAPGAAPLVLPQPAPAVALDATGWCALATWNTEGSALEQTRLYDVASGASTALDGLTHVTWL